MRPGGVPAAPLAPEFLALAETSPDPIVRFGLDGLRTYVNPAGARILGADPDARAGHPLAALVRGRQRDSRLNATIGQAIRQVAEQGVPVELPVRCQLPGGGEERVFHLSFLPERSAAGTLTGVLHVVRDLTARTRAEADLARSEARFRLALQHSPLGLALADRQGRWIQANPTLGQMFGCPAEELAGTTLETRILPKDQPAYRRAARKLLGGQPTSLQLDLGCRHPDGQTLRIRWSASPFRTAGMEEGAFLFQFEDISAQQDTLDRLERTSRALARTLDAVFVLEYPPGPASRVIYANDAACRSLGYRREVLVGMAVRDFDLGQDETTGLGPGGHRPRPNPALTFETRYRARSGRVFPVEVRSSSFRHQGRRLSIAVVREVSERHKAQRRIEANERDFLALAENALDWISCHDHRGRPTYVNPRLRDFLGQRGLLAGGETPREIGKRMGGHLSPDFQRGVRQVLRTGAATTLDVEFDGAGGTSCLIQLHITPECDAAGAVHRVLVVGRDMTAWREDRRRLEATHAQLRELAAQLENAREQERRKVARELHDELGQRLIALRLGVHSLSARLGLAPEQAAPLLGQVDRTLATVRGICASLRPPVLDFGLGPALHWLGAEFSARAGIPCAVQVPDGDLDLGEARTALLFRVAQEALDNVARHARASAARLTLAASGRRIWLEIQDDGAGFDPGVPSPPGTFGLLAIRERARAVGAEFDIDSSPRWGTRILLRLPAAEGIRAE